MLSVVSRRWLVQALAETGAFAAGIARGDEGLRIAETADHPYSLFNICLGIGALYVCQGDFPQAIPFLARSLELCQVWHIRQNMLSSALALGHALALAGQVSAALALLEQHIEPAALTRQMGRVALSAARVSDIYTPPHTAPGRADRCFDYPRWDNTFPKIGSGTFFKRRLDMACLLSVPFLTLLRIRISQRGNGNDACRGLNPQGMRNGFSPHMG